MKNTIYLDSDFNFLLLENEEDNGLNQTQIYINIPTSAAANQALDISVGGGAPITVSIPSSAKVNFELSQQYWADNGDVEITPKNDDITGDTITIHYPETFTASAALNYLVDDEFEIVAQNEEFAGGGSGSGSGSGGGSAFDFVETIRNIGFRLLDEPSNVNAYFDEIAEEVQIKWTDPLDIITNEPAPAAWAGTVVVRKEGSAPLHRWDGVEIIDSTTRDQYASSALIDNTIDVDKSYYYGIFPYDTKGDYRFTKVILITSQPIPAPHINSLNPGINAINVNYSIAYEYSYSYITLVYKKNSAPADKTDGTAVSLSASNTSIDINGLDAATTYYFKIFAQVQGASEELESNTESATTIERHYITVSFEDLLKSIDLDHIKTDTITQNVPGGGLTNNLKAYIGTDWLLAYARYDKPNVRYLQAGQNGEYIIQASEPSSDEEFEFFPVKDQYVGYQLRKMKAKVMMTASFSDTAGRFGSLDTLTNNVTNIFYFDYNEDGSMKNIYNANVWYDLENDVTTRNINLGQYIRLFVNEGYWKFKDIEFELYID